MTHTQLIKQLRKLGITQAIESTGTTEGTNCIFLRNGDDTETFAGYDITNPQDKVIQSELLARFKDSNLK